MCSTVSTCLGHGTDEPIGLQMYPIVIQKGMKINISLPRDINGTAVIVHMANKDGFHSCDFNASTPIPNISTIEKNLEIETDNFSTGHNYVIYFLYIDVYYPCNTNASICTIHMCKERLISLWDNYTATIQLQDRGVDAPGNDKLSCNDGNRVKVTVKGSNCTENGHGLTCSLKGHCTALPLDEAFKCRCCDGFFGNTCETNNDINNDDVTTCNDAVCLNGGTCIEDNITADVSNQHIGTDTNSTHFSIQTRCECNSHFTGSSCETRLDSCKSSPCVHGVCVERVGGFQCYCIPGFHGKSCEFEYNECLSGPCKHGGTCIDKIDKYECRCIEGHTGYNCEVKVDMCRPNPCFQNVSCTDLGETFHCACPSGFTGHTCSFPINECLSNPCKNDGTCRDLYNGFECICPITFAGVHCEYMMDVFAPPLESAEMSGLSHKHNLYIVAGTLSGAIILVLIVLVACYCKMHETYKQLAWRRLRYKKRSLSCPDLESYSEIATANKPRLSVDAIWEATSLCYDNATFDTPLQQHRI